MTDADIVRLWDAIDGQRKDLGQIATGLAVMGEQMRGIREDMKAHVRPCEDIKKHIDAHVKQEDLEKQTWRDVALRVLGPTLAGIGGGVAAFFGAKGIGD
jgi:hypothetical protein